MIKTLFYFLPCLVCLLWFVSYLFKVKTQRQQLYMWTMLAATLYYAAFGIYLYPETDYYTMVRIETFCLPACLCMSAGLVVYLHMLYTGKELHRTLLWVMLTPAIIEGSILGILYYILGFDYAAEVGATADRLGHLPASMSTPLTEAYCLFSENVVNYLAMAYFVALVASCVRILHKEHYCPTDSWRFLFQGMKTTHSRLIAAEMFLLCIALFPMLYPGRLYIADHTWQGVLMSVAVSVMLHLIAHTEFYSSDEHLVSLYTLSHLHDEITGDFIAHSAPTPAMPTLSEEEESTVVETLSVTKEEECTAPEQADMENPTETEETTGLATSTETLPHLSKNSLVLASKFRKMMEEDKLWKNEELNVAMICDMLEVGRTTLSSILNIEYGMPFREIVNQYRIEEAKTYMLAHPKATQEVIAEHCGFKNAQYFNTQFKKQVGDTPAMWLATQLPA